MTYKTLLPKPISVAIGGFGLSRSLLVQLLSSIHHDIPRDYEEYRKFRVEGNESDYRYKILLQEEPIQYLFTFAIDDSTAYGYLIVDAITCSKKRI